MLTAKTVDALLRGALAKPEASSGAKKRLMHASGEDAALVVKRMLPTLAKLAATEARYAWSVDKKFAKYIALTEILAGLVGRKAPFAWDDLATLMDLADRMGFRRASLKRVLAQVEARKKKAPLSKAERTFLKKVSKRYASNWHGHRPIKARLVRILAK